MNRILRAPASPEQIEETLQPLLAHIKPAVAVEGGVLAGGGVMHADCESALLEDGSAQDDIWGADWAPPAGR